jgi:NADH dehydrogenase (ubiquinone) 1 beta subcomplex subunit 7
MGEKSGKIDLLQGGEGRPRNVEREVIPREKMNTLRVPIQNRDLCAAAVYRLNACRDRTYFAPWKCEHERHEAERCYWEE